MSNDDETTLARRAIVNAAKRMLRGDLPYIEGAREICAQSFLAGLEDDPDIRVFVGINSETDAFPFGAVRSLWNSEALKQLQPKMDHVEEWVRLLSAPHCQNLVRRLDPET